MRTLCDAYHKEFVSISIQSRTYLHVSYVLSFKTPVRMSTTIQILA